MSDKIVLVTGAGSGIGRAVVLAFLRDGCRVVLAGRRMAALRETIEIANTDQSRALAVSTDVTDPVSVGSLFQRTEEVFHHVPRPNSAPYTATKHAVTGLTRSTSLDGREYDIACGQIDIGNAATEMAAKMAEGVQQADGSIRPEPLIDVSLIADAVLYMANLPLEANVQFMTVMATKMPYIGRG